MAENIFRSYFAVFLNAKPYSLYVLFILLVTFMLNQLDRFVLPITAVKSAQELEFGDRACLKLSNTNASNQELNKCSLKSAENETICLNLTSSSGANICQYNYNGQGTAYQVINGPVFILVFTTMGIVVSMFADIFKRYRTFILAASLAFWSLMTFLSGFVSSYWLLALFRFGLGLGQAGCNPIATSIIADYFPLELRGSALGVYNWGIYTGYSLSFAIGSAILKSLDWRWVYRICGIPGIIVAVILALTVKNKINTEAEASTSQTAKKKPGNAFNLKYLKEVLYEFTKPSVILLCIAGSIRNAAGYVWAGNNNQYYKDLGETPEQVSAYLSWIPIVFGIIGSFVGGFVSDRVAKKAGPSMRVWVLVISQICAAPFVAGVLFFDPPYSYWFLIPTYIIGEMWIGVCLSVLVELVPEHLRITGVGIYFFIISNIGGNMGLLVPPTKAGLKDQFNLTELEALRGALYIYYPGEYVVGSALFLLTLFVLNKDIAKTKSAVNNRKNSSETLHENDAFNEKIEDEAESF